MFHRYIHVIMIYFKDFHGISCVYILANDNRRVFINILASLINLISMKTMNVEPITCGAYKCLPGVTSNIFNYLALEYFGIHLLFLNQIQLIFIMRRKKIYQFTLFMFRSHKYILWIIIA